MASIKSVVSIDPGKSGTLTILYAGRKVGLAPERGDLTLIIFEVKRQDSIHPRQQVFFYLP